ncbi:hypothetical protein PEBR_38952 [Penicillium brasilianum]|uniref:Uncharacterized protein n=1 Tax=Penicillium brasilianum TaxID=104259 RepID=A0A1S9RAJ7_PENBI|nr:hypothetical protein PEBR_38952 [Penicillium brasilianum]
MKLLPTITIFTVAVSACSDPAYRCKNPQGSKDGDHSKTAEICAEISNGAKVLGLLQSGCTMVSNGLLNDTSFMDLQETEIGISILGVIAMLIISTDEETARFSSIHITPSFLAYHSWLMFLPPKPSLFEDPSVACFQGLSFMC